MAELKFEYGEKVTYLPTGEHGMVKKCYPNFAFVVFHCEGDWENFHNYTGQSTRVDKLVSGWITGGGGDDDGLVDPVPGPLIAWEVLPELV